jgi:Nucleotidyltransferase domain
MSKGQHLPSDVRKATERHLAALDKLAPGLVDGLYLTGSVTLGDYHRGRSDIDFMAFTTRPVADPDVVALLSDVHAALTADLHAALPGTGHYDGNYIDLAGLPAVPDDEPRAPHVVNGTFHGSDPNGQLTPATWAEFTRYAIAVRGPKRADLGIAIAHDRLNHWLLGNLNGYWKSSAVSGLEKLRQHEGGEAVPGEAVAWMATGAARLHYTLATGDIASKSAAGRYAISLFPSYSSVVNAALGWRATGRGEFTCADWISCAEMTLGIVADANRGFASSGSSTLAGSCASRRDVDQVAAERDQRRAGDLFGVLAQALADDRAES